VCFVFIFLLVRCQRYAMLPNLCNLFKTFLPRQGDSTRLRIGYWGSTP